MNDETTAPDTDTDTDNLSLDDELLDTPMGLADDDREPADIDSDEGYDPYTGGAEDDGYDNGYEAYAGRAGQRPAPQG